MATQPRRVITPKEAVEFRAIGGLIKRLIHPQTTGSVNLQLSICYLHPGEEVYRHRHPNEEAYFVLAGTGVMYLEGHPEIPLAPYVAVYVPPNLEHGQKNTGDVPLVIVTALSPPLTTLPEITDPRARPAGA
jgi:mannose-6-phosphate isomerase-like protein (cupin superfamily)